MSAGCKQKNVGRKIISIAKQMNKRDYRFPASGGSLNCVTSALMNGVGGVISTRVVASIRITLCRSSFFFVRLRS